MRIAVLGAGSVGRRHIQNLLAMGERQVLGCDTAAQTTCSDAIGFENMGLAVQIVREVADVWNWQPEAVLICTPPVSHAELAYQAASEGAKAIFIEKPLGLKLPIEDWLRFLSSPEAPITTMVACNWRFHAGPLVLKRWLDEGSIGGVLSARISMGYYLPDTKQDYKTAYTATTGVVLDVGSHAVDLVLWLLGPACLRSAVVRPAESIGLKGTDGLTGLLLEHDSGAVSTVSVSWLQRDRYTIQIVGTKAVAEWQDNKSAILYRGEEIHQLYGTHGVDVNQMYVDELAHFLACVRENRPTCNPVSSAVDVLKILLEAQQCGR